MNSLLEIMTNPDQVKIKDAARVLQLLLKDEVAKIDTNFKEMSDNLRNQIEHTEQIKQMLSVENDKLVSLADDATKKIANMSQRLENTVDGLNSIVSSGGWSDAQHATDSFVNYTDELMNKIAATTATTSDNAIKIQEQITQCIETEKQINEQLQNSFNTNATGMDNMTQSANELEKKLNELSTSVTDGFNSVQTSSAQYDETMHQNDKLLNEYLAKLSEFGKRADKELTKQLQTLTQTANVVGARIRLSESSIDKQTKKLESVIEALDNSTNSTKVAVHGITNELTEKSAASECADSVKSMGIGVRETLIEMNKAHTQLSGQSENLIKMSTETTEQLKPLSELIEKYYVALPDLSAGSKAMSENLEQIVNTMVEKINIMKTTISESLEKINSSSTQLGDLAGESRQQMIDLMADYAKAVDAMQSLNKQMMVARASAPMDAIKVAPSAPFKPISTKDFLANVDTIFDKLYEQSVDLTRAIGSDIPEIVWQKYNNGDKKIFAKWLIKMFDATDKKQIRELLKSDSVFRSQASQFVRNFDKVLKGADQTNDAEKLKATLLKTDLGTIYSTISKHV